MGITMLITAMRGPTGVDEWPSHNVFVWPVPGPQASNSPALFLYALHHSVATRVPTSCQFRMAWFAAQPRKWTRPRILSRFLSPYLSNCCCLFSFISNPSQELGSLQLIYLFSTLVFVPSLPLVLLSEHPSSGDSSLQGLSHPGCKVFSGALANVEILMKPLLVFLFSPAHTKRGRVFDVLQPRVKSNYDSLRIRSIQRHMFFNDRSIQCINQVRTTRLSAYFFISPSQDEWIGRHFHADK